MLAYVGDLVEPELRGGIDCREVGELRASQEVLFHIADARFDATFLVAGGHITWHDFEVVMPRVVQIPWVEHRRDAGQASQYCGLEIVHHDLLWHAESS